VPEALGLARATLRTIKQNLFWAFFYNALGVPLAALGFISPILCAGGHGRVGLDCDWQRAAVVALALSATARSMDGKFYRFLR